jgi:hypothetical protein
MQSANVKIEQEFQSSPVIRRLLCALVYSLGIFASISVLGVLSVSADCQIDGKCSNKDRVVDVVLSAVWVLGSVFVAYKAWRSELIGCRKKALV